jgi:DNA polymerase II large subunit
MEAKYLNSHDRYFQQLREQFDRVYSLARQARGKGLDPAPEPESLITHDVAERVEKAVGPAGIANRIRELSVLMQRELVALKIAEEIALGGYIVNGEEAAEQAIRTAAAILDEGVTAAPIEGIADVRIRTNQDGSQHLVVYFAGPIRSAGGTDMALILVIADYVRHQLGLDKYRATELEAKRFVEELRVYEREVARFQFKVSDEELFNSITRLPVEVNGVETDPIEVSSYRNVPRVDTNRVRGGALRVVHDGLIGRSQKVLKIVDSLSIEGWNWLREIKPPIAESDEAGEFMFMEDVLGGRPIFSFPQIQGGRGGFRLRYGRARNTGLAAIGLHPSTMQVLRKFIAIGTQLRIEKPGKAGIVGAVDGIEPPVVKLNDGSVVRLADPDQAERTVRSVDKILFLGDILVGFGEFLENNRSLLPSGFVEEWWAELTKQAATTISGGLEGYAEQTGVPLPKMLQYLEGALAPTPEEALRLARSANVPLHPRYTWFWENIEPQDFDYLRAKMVDPTTTTLSRGRIITKNDGRVKDILENLCLPHKLESESLVIESESPILSECLGVSSPLRKAEGTDVFEKIFTLSNIRVMKKAPVYVGSRMGRPEKAKQREMRPIVHCLFPLGLAGGARRNLRDAAAERTLISVEIAYRKCEKCGEITHRMLCERCGEGTRLRHVCGSCGAETEGTTCHACRGPARLYNRRNIPLRDFLEQAERNLSLVQIPETVKGVRGLTNETRTPEPLEKGLLRAKHDVSLFKDGTIRFDATNAPLTHFKPAEIGVSVEKIRAFGYEVDAQGEPLTSESQRCNLAVHDIIVPEKCGDYFVRTAKFLDELLQKFYGIHPFYNAKTREDLLGHLVIGLSPHTSVGVIGRIIGFTNASVCFAHPFWHATKRRDCDGDEDSVSLALDVLLNFSKAFLPSRIGGIMDAPILLTQAINPKEIARQAFNIETVERFPLRFFEETCRRSDPKGLTDIIEVTSARLGSDSVLDSLGFTHDTENINSGNLESAYKKLDTMFEKVAEQLKLAESIRAVDAREVARRVLSTHFMRDLVGNVKAFAGQRFRCTKCNMKFRRVPLKGNCLRCGGKLSLTVYRGGVEKYLTVAEDLVKRYNLGEYHKQRLLLLHEEIKSLFSEHQEEGKQPSLAEFV